MPKLYAPKKHRTADRRTKREVIARELNDNEVNIDLPFMAALLPVPAPSADEEEEIIIFDDEEEEEDENVTRYNTLRGFDENDDPVTDRRRYENRVYDLGELSDFERQLYEEYSAKLDAMGETLDQVDFNDADYTFADDWYDPSTYDHLDWLEPLRVPRRETSRDEMGPVLVGTDERMSAIKGTHPDTGASIHGSVAYARMIAARVPNRTPHEEREYQLMLALLSDEEADEIRYHLAMADIRDYAE